MSDIFCGLLPSSRKFLAFSTHAYCILHSEAKAFFEAELDSLLFTNFMRYFLGILYEHYVLEMVLGIGKTGKFLIRFQRLFDSFVLPTHRQLILESFDFSLRQLSQTSWFKSPEKQIATNISYILINPSIPPWWNPWWNT